MAARIAIVFEFATLYGGERSMLAAVDSLTSSRATDFEFIPIAPPTGDLADTLRDRGLDTIPLNLRPAAGRLLPRGQACEALAAAIRRAAPEIVHANSLSMGRLTGAVAPDVAAACTAHLRDIIGLSRAAVADLNRNRILIAVSRATRDFHIGQGMDGQRIRVVYNGVDCAAFAPRPATGSLRRELRLSDEAFLIAAVGQIALRKGHDVLAAAAILAAERMPNAHYVIVGGRASQKPESAAFEQDFASRFRQAGLESRLHCLGYRSDVAAIMNECNLLVHAARQEPLGRVLLEAAASGLPIVATRVGGTEEILRDGESARLIPAGDVEALAAAMVALHDDPQQRRGYSRAARAVTESRFAIAPRAEALGEAWREAS
jgi:glycosyltransferase involved in cell wall biosynthesis